MHSDERLAIQRIEIWPVNIPLTDPFIVATGELGSVQNLFVRATLRNGSVGYGEIAPFQDVTGEDRASSFAMAKKMAMAALGQSAGHYRRLAKVFQEIAPRHPAARCGLETALVDALEWVYRTGSEQQEILSRGAIKTAREFEMEKQANRTLEVYHDVKHIKEPKLTGADSLWEQARRRLSAEWKVWSARAKAGGRALANGSRRKSLRSKDSPNRRRHSCRL